METQVRRSPRLKNTNKGFRANTCSDRKCLACAPKPPVLSKEVIKKLAFDFYKLDQTEINDETLQAKKKKSSLIARARISIADPEEGEERAQEQILADPSENLL